MYVNVNCQKLSENSQNIKNDYLEKYNSCVNNILEIVENIETVWQGEEYNNFYNKMTEVIVDLNSLRNYVETCSDYVKSYSDIMIKMDEKYKSRVISIT